MSEEKALTIQEAQKGVSAFGGGITHFEDAQRMAKALAESNIVPQAYQRNLSNCLVALEVSHRTGSSVLAVMQNLHIIHGKPSWSAQYVIGVINGSGRYTPLRFKITQDGEITIKGKQVKNLVCVAVATDKSSGEILTGPAVSVQTAVNEGWYTKDGSKWPNMTELMLQYRAASFFGRLYCAELLLGMQSEEEARDVGPAAAPTGTVEAKSVNEKIRQRKAKAEAIEVEAKPVIDPPPASENVGNVGAASVDEVQKPGFY